MVHLASELDDATLVRAVQAGEHEAFEVLFRRHYATVHRVCARRLASVGEAEEVTQASFVRAYERIDQCNDDRRFGAWVQVIAYRLCADAWRVRARTTPMAEPPAAAGERGGGVESCEEAILRSERVAVVRRALSALPRRQREVLVARDLEGRRPREVAAALAVSVGAVDSLLLRARRRMVAACRATGEHGGVSVQLSTTTSLAATSAASNGGAVVGPLARMAESVTAAIDAASAGVAVALGLGPAGPTAAQRVAGLVGAGALLLAPLAPGGGPGERSLPAAPGLSVTLPVSLPGVLTRGVPLPVPGPVTVPGWTMPSIPPVPSPSPVLPAVAVSSAAVPSATLPDAPEAPAVPILAARAGAADIAGTTAALSGTAAVADGAVDALSAVVGAAEGLVSAVAEQVTGVAGGGPPDSQPPDSPPRAAVAALPPEA